MSLNRAVQFCSPADYTTNVCVYQASGPCFNEKLFILAQDFCCKRIMFWCDVVRKSVGHSNTINFGYTVFIGFKSYLN